jgi:hypothetical protein
VAVEVGCSSRAFVGGVWVAVADRRSVVVVAGSRGCVAADRASRELVSRAGRSAVAVEVGCSPRAFVAGVCVAIADRRSVVVAGSRGCVAVDRTSRELVSRRASALRSDLLSFAATPG